MSRANPDRSRHADRVGAQRRPTAEQAASVLERTVKRRGAAVPADSDGAISARQAAPPCATLAPITRPAPAQPEAAHGDDAAAPALAPSAAKIVDEDVIDVRAVAKLVHVGRNTLYAMVARDEIPHRRFGRCIRFSRTAVVRWLASWSSQGAKERH
jgi:excisionase family DNA binding protein